MIVMSSGQVRGTKLNCLVHNSDYDSPARLPYVHAEVGSGATVSERVPNVAVLLRGC